MISAAVAVLIVSNVEIMCVFSKVYRKCLWSFLEVCFGCFDEGQAAANQSWVIQSWKTISMFEIETREQAGAIFGACFGTRYILNTR